MGSTIKACVELDRKGYGVELSPKWYEIAKERLAAESNHHLGEEQLICGDSRNLKDYFKNNSFDFIVTSPPYWNILDKKDHKANERVVNGHETKYSESEQDLGNIADYNAFLNELSKIFFQCYDLLKPGKYICIIISDFRHKSEFYPFHADLMNKLTDKKQERFFC